MPTYMYTCENCQNIVDRNKPMSEATNEETCEKCGGLMRRMYTPPGVQIN